MEIKANAEGLLNWLQFFLTTAQNYENVKGLNLEFINYGHDIL